MKRQFFIAGVQFRPKDEIKRAVEGLSQGIILTLVPEPTNKFDPNAVKIIYEEPIDENLDIELFLGYVPKKYSSEVAGMLSIDAPVMCIVDEVNPLAKTYEMFKVTVTDEDEEESTEEGDEI